MFTVDVLLFFSYEIFQNSESWCKTLVIHVMDLLIYKCEYFLCLFSDTNISPTEEGEYQGLDRPLRVGDDLTMVEEDITGDRGNSWETEKMTVTE